MGSTQPQNPQVGQQAGQNPYRQNDQTGGQKIDKDPGQTNPQVDVGPNRQGDEQEPGTPGKQAAPQSGQQGGTEPGKQGENDPNEQGGKTGQDGNDRTGKDENRVSPH